MAESHAIREAIEVNLSSAPRRYDIVIRPGLLDTLGEECRRILAEGARVLIITDANLAGSLLPRAEAALKSAGFSTLQQILPAGETSKSLEQATLVFEKALQNKFTRKDAILALGGGVVGDLAGFCASTYHRGLSLIQVPTTLVAQVDSSIGGKTAVNFGQVKNIVGTFYQPLAVLQDPDLLESLPERERVAGLAEVVKYGLIETSATGESGFYEWLMAHANNLRPVYAEMIYRCCAIKAAVVMQDELETKGLRYYLNLGHTYGHAYEALSNYRLLHGEAVAIGLEKAATQAMHLGLWPKEHVRQLGDLLRQLGFGPVLNKAAGFQSLALLTRMQQDKKNVGGGIKLVLPDGQPGQVVVRDDVSEGDILTVLSMQ